MAEKGTDFEPVTLTNVAEGELERQFAECLNDVITAFEEQYEYEPSANTIRARVDMTVEFQKNLETGGVLVGVRAKYTAPKRRAAMRAAFIQNGTVLVESAEQMALPTEASNVTPITKSEETND